MKQNISSPQYLVGSLLSEQQWSDLDRRLFARTLHFIHRLQVPAWRGQEEDMARDIVQITLERALIRLRQADTGEATPIASLFSFCARIAHNLCIDQQRHEQRLVRLYTETDQPRWDLEEQLSAGYDPIGDAIEQIDQASLLAIIVHLIVTLPNGQRTALLIGLAHIALPFPALSSEPTPLETALAHIGITLRDYTTMYPTNAMQKNRYSSSLSLAYKRLHDLVESQSCSQSFVA